MIKNESNILLEQIRVGTFKNFCYLIGDLQSAEAAVVDPAWDIPKILQILKLNSLKLKYIINTHSHHDHVEGNDLLEKPTSAQIVMSYRSPLAKDIGVHDSDVLSLGKIVKLCFILTPGHSPDSICILVNGSFLITGDTLFIGECGRTDLPGGDPSELFDSFEKIRRLDPKLMVYPGHDYGKIPNSTLGEELENNYTLAIRTREEFIRFMHEP